MNSEKAEASTDEESSMSGRVEPASERFYPWSQAEKDQALDLYENGKKPKEIYHILNLKGERVSVDVLKTQLYRGMKRRQNAQ